MSSERQSARLANLRAIFGAILSYVRDGGRFWMRTDRTSNGELVMTMRVADADEVQNRISGRLARFLRGDSGQRPD